jgi:hypothetical protein
MYKMNFPREGVTWIGVQIVLMEQHDLKCKQLFEYQHLLLLRDIWWSKF